MLTGANSAGNVFQQEKSKFSTSSKPKFSVSIMVEELKEQLPQDDNNKEININNCENSAATTTTATTAATTDEDLQNA